MNQRVVEMGSEEIIDESTVKKEVEEAKKEIAKDEVETEGEKTEKKKPKIGKKHLRGKKYILQNNKIDREKVYSCDDAVDLVIKTAKVKFDATIELHARLSVDGIRGTLSLPAGAAKEKKVVEVTEKNIDEFIAKTKSSEFDFDILVATPQVMPKLAQVAKILGPKGLMPSLKSGTVVEDTAVAIAEIKSGKIEYKQDEKKNLHLAIAKVSFGKDKIAENLNTVLKVLPKNKVVSLFLTSTMGPSVKMEIPK
ncbi:MAG: large subunit ribosomal protein L1 [Candidatus Berkelbacteria bacterium Athens1014_28]|uniref:Ribosomal protein n=1 Tax=Candidatus Berkelbacteria bacterium Athens1014_28 TaxID=2017145 RepID=A0A554LLL6_9BACT|nr:MAG: large subunit ribosomal protein L1 [Candidatus Berkelbacteria bacterium Athens1014_28]